MALANFDEVHIGHMYSKDLYKIDNSNYEYKLNS